MESKDVRKIIKDGKEVIAELYEEQATVQEIESVDTFTGREEVLKELHETILNNQKIIKEGEDVTSEVNEKQATKTDP
ncbi:unnamed protein product, partial [Allacma fusca]